MPGGTSKTAEYVALFRAIESSRPEEERLFSDPYADCFLDGKLKLGARLARNRIGRRLVCSYVDRNWPGSRPSVSVRTRLIDDAVRSAIADGAIQMAILGAGYDTRAHRLGADPALKVFELDQPPTQERKKARLLAQTGSLQENVTYVPFDLLDEGVGKPLEMAGFKRGTPSVCVWEGVLSYLTPEAVDQTIEWVTSACASGSRLVFTYIDVALLERGGSSQPPWSAQVARVGEPFLFGLDPDTLDDFLGTRGLRKCWDVSTAEAIRDEPLITGRSDAPDFYRVAEAEVTAHH